MITLGIETSCDETAVAVVKGKKVLSNCVSSSISLHKDFGGVIPEIACRCHLEYINYVLKAALRKAGLGLDDIGLIAVTTRPGLVGALLVGISMAKGISIAGDIPLIGVDHLAAHLHAVFMDGSRVRFPYIGMVVSGGHTSLFRVGGVDRYKPLGRTLDDAAGEAFDKVAKLLGLGYPGGPAIEKTAVRGKIDRALFPRKSFDETLNFSFSGIKTSVLYYARDRLRKKGLLMPGHYKTGDISRLAKALGRGCITSIAASFQDSITDILTEKAIECCRREGIRRLVLGGGVIANRMLREKMTRRSSESGIDLFIPDKKMCVDNAAMVAGLGAALYKKGVRSDLSVTASSSTAYS